jgi:hypothetical protein
MAAHEAKALAPLPYLPALEGREFLAKNEVNEIT